jgi:hypothetical protein
MICIILSFVKTKEGKNKVLDDEISMEIKTMKPKQPNWANFEVVAFINAKKNEHKSNFETIDFRDNMETMTTKWKHIFDYVMQQV